MFGDTVLPKLILNCTTQLIINGTTYPWKYVAYVYIKQWDCNYLMLYVVLWKNGHAAHFEVVKSVSLVPEERKFHRVFFLPPQCPLRLCSFSSEKTEVMSWAFVSLRSRHFLSWAHLVSLSGEKQSDIENGFRCQKALPTSSWLWLSGTLQICNAGLCQMSQEQQGKNLQSAVALWALWPLKGLLKVNLRTAHVALCYGFIWLNIFSHNSFDYSCKLAFNNKTLLWYLTVVLNLH